MFKHKPTGYANNNPWVMPKAERDAKIAEIMRDLPSDAEADMILTASVARHEAMKAGA